MTDIAIERLPIPVVISRATDHRILDVNPFACEYLGRSRAELLRLRMDDIVAPERVPALDGAYLQARAGGLVVDTAYLRGDGARVLGQAHVIGLTDDGDAVIGAILDTTSYHASERRAALLSELAPLLGTSERPEDDEDLDIDTLTQRVEAAIGAHLGWRVRIVWSLPDGPSGLPALVGAGGAAAGCEADVDPAVDLVRPIMVGSEQIGCLVVEAGQYLDRSDQEFVQVLAAGCAAFHVMLVLRNQLDASLMFEAGFRSTEVGMQVVHPDGTLLRVNQAFADIAGRTVDELVGMNWRDITHPDDVEEDPEIRWRLDQGHQQIMDDEKRYVRPDGTVVWGRVNVVAVSPTGRQDSSERVHIVQVVDVTAQVEAMAAERALRHALQASERRVRSLVEASFDFVARVSADGRVVDLNDAVIQAHGRERDELTGLDIGQLLSPRVARLTLDGVAEVIETGVSTEIDRIWIEEPDDVVTGWFTFRFTPELPVEPDESIEHVYVVASDITNVVEKEQRLAAMALSDPLTGLSNRAAVFDRLQHALDRLRRGERRGVAVVVIDLDHFKAINDTYGHGAGDNALRLVADILRAEVRAEDTVGRMGGDEFVVVLEELTDPDLATTLAQRIADALNDGRIPVGEGRSASLSASVGVAFSSAPMPTDDLMMRADRAMYEAKRHGRGRLWTEHDDDDAPSSESNGVLLRELSMALERGQFRLHYQPIASAASGTVVGFEALLRWCHPEQGLLAPDRFLDALLSSGQIGPVGHWVVRTAVRQLAAWSERPETAGLQLHVNVSPAELSYSGFAQLLRDELAAYGVDPQLLAVEVTEQALAGTVVSSSALAEIAATGVRLVLDDFGTGVSSMAHLRTRPLHGIKIDRSFVSGIDCDHRDRAIAESMAVLGSALGIEVTAEGVETVEQTEWLTSIGCDRLQGWHIGYPVPAEEATEIAIDRNAVLQ